MRTFDCVIAGAGPAGSATAIHLAGAGLHVALIDRSTFPRAKPCGDCLSPGANPLLKRLGILDRVHAAGASLHGWRIFSPSGASFETRFDQITADPLQCRAYAVDRSVFDAILVDAAREAGAELLKAHITDVIPNGDFHEIACRDRDSSQRVRGRLLIGADGLRSIVSRRCGLIGRAPRLHKLSLTAHTRIIRDVAGFGELHVIDGACLGIASVEAPSNATGLCNVSLVVDSTRFGRDVAADPHAFFDHMLRQFPAVRSRIITHAKSARLLGSGPFDRPARVVVAQGVALVGDAAGYFDPFTGQGIGHALAAAERLAFHANDAFRTGSPRQPLHGYAREHAALVRGSRRVQRIIDRVCASPGVMDRAVRALGAAPGVAARLTAVTGDLLPARSLLSPNVVLTFLTRFLTAETTSAYDR